MLAFLKSNRRWIVLILNLIFLALPIVQVGALMLALSGYGVSGYILSPVLLGLVSRPWFGVGIVAVSVLDLVLIGMALANKNTPTRRKIVLAVLGVILFFIVIEPMVARIVFAPKY